MSSSLWNNLSTGQARHRSNSGGQGEELSPSHSSKRRKTGHVLDSKETEPSQWQSSSSDLRRLLFNQATAATTNPYPTPTPFIDLLPDSLADRLRRFIRPKDSSGQRIQAQSLRNVYYREL
ncbi:hypothetical protein P691DRAFT_812259 [Macrolepiota fuliginosa MF-IS2]|uniref:Uncharacterized protein n=1 Tax=Macrolepiota fuliginosa MF-IS2 TaxID=1400762 RepID=A0A9P5WYV8_9AGAR|nr:hypothetical protein P691DRAFT_812259 [Macrolepiota fuliginosa MF-IS2]